MQENAPLLLQYLNILISGVSLVIMIVAAIAYGRLTKTVEVHDIAIMDLKKEQKDLANKVYTIAAGHNEKRG